jgi:hypothetical protein
MTESIDQYVTYIPEYKVILCQSHKYCLVPGGVKRHFRDYHKNITWRIKKAIIDYSATLDLIDPTEVQVPIYMVKGLKIYEDGYQCLHQSCGHCAATEGSIRQHYRSHNIQQENWKRQTVQTFFQGSNCRYKSLY